MNANVKMTALFADGCIWLERGIDSEDEKEKRGWFNACGYYIGKTVEEAHYCRTHNITAKYRKCRL